jgi:hypothetical protein
MVLSRPTFGIEQLPARNRTIMGSDSASRAAAQARAERLAFRRKRAWTMNTTPSAMMSQS